MAAVRSSPRLRVLLYSNPSGKPAVFAPRLSRVSTSDRTLRSKNNKSSAMKDPSETSSPSRLSRGKKASEKRPVVNKTRSKGAQNKGRASENALVGKRQRLASSDKRQQSLTSQSGKAQIGGSKRSRGGGMLGGVKTKSVEVATKCKQRRSSKALATSASSPVKNLERGVVNSVTDAESMSTCVAVKRKRGRPPKSVASCKRVKVAPNIARKSRVDTVAEGPKVVIDLTCDNETIGDDIDDTDSTDAVLTAPIQSSFFGLDPSQTNGVDSPSLMQSLEATKGQPDGEGVYGKGDSARNNDSTDIEIESDYLRASLDPDETIAQLFDLVTKEGHPTRVNDSGESEVATIPSLKRSNNITPLVTTTIDIANSEHTPEIDNSSSDTPDTLSSPTEEEYPQPSTPQQKLVRRIARQKQLEEMRFREAALSREERLLRRKGVLPDTAKVTPVQGSTKRISWRDETDLVEMFIYSPTRDDDDDTVSIQSDDAPNMEVALSAT